MHKEPTVSLSPSHVLDLLPPFPIVLVSTRDNVLTINQVEYFTFRPLRIGIAIAHTRYSYGLLREEGEFIVNVPDASLVDAVKTCGTLSGRDGDKFAATGLERMPAMSVDAVCVAQCGAHIECRVVREIPFEHRTWFVGEVVAAQRGINHAGTDGLLCGRYAYMLADKIIGKR